MLFRTHHRTIRTVASFAALAATNVASANIILYYTGPTNYTYLVRKVPDFDQKRSVLPNDGKSHCVPTSALNWFAYIANHGYPNMAPGSGSWAGQGPYNIVSVNLLTMGLMMGTNPNSGTALNGAVNGMAGWIDISPYTGQFIVIGANANLFQPYNFDNLAQQAMLGRLVMPRIGWYIEGSGGVITRDGGHLTTMTRAKRNGTQRTIGLNDPASDNGLLNVQSEFTREDYNCVDVLRTVDGLPRFVTRVNNYKSGTKQGYIDGYRAIVPLFGLTTSTDNTSVVMKMPFAFGSAQSSEKSFPTAAPISHLKISSDALSALVMTSSSSPASSSIKKLDFATGQMTTLFGNQQATTQIATGRFGDIYALQQGADSSFLARIIPGTPDPMSILVPEPVSAITYDDFTDSVLLFAHQTRRLYRYPYQLVANHAPLPPEIFQLPGNLPTGGSRFLTVSPVTGHVWYSTGLSNGFWEIIIPGDGSVIVNPVTAPSSFFLNDLSIDDAGFMYGCDTSVNLIRMYAPHQPGDGSVTLLATGQHPLANSPCRLRLAMLVSRHNFDEATAKDPAQWDIDLPTEFAPSIPDCPADFDGNDVVDVVDLLRLLGEWGTNGFSDADLNYDGVVDVIDLLQLLGSWGPCP